MPVEMKPVTGSNISAVGYDGDAKELHVQFSNGGAYVYAGVPDETHAGLMAAESVGKYFHAAIRGKFQGRKKD